LEKFHILPIWRTWNKILGLKGSDFLKSYEIDILFAQIFVVLDKNLCKFEKHGFKE